MCQDGDWGCTAGAPQVANTVAVLISSYVFSAKQEPLLNDEEHQVDCLRLEVASELLKNPCLSGFLVHDV